ncbi:MAG TPA: RNA methyltransferase [Bacillota bacterium]|nr:RNA methyltransferase [Bacillota bacterium]
MTKDKTTERQFVDSPEYLAKKEYFKQFITVYGKKTVRDLLAFHPDVKVERVLVAKDSRSEAIREIVQLATQRKITVKEMDRDQLSRISKNKDEDQGVVADVVGKIDNDWSAWLATAPSNARLIALDGITTPANLGMIIRSTVASGLDGLLIPEAGMPSINQPFVIKAAAATVFQANIYRHPTLLEALQQAVKAGFVVYGLSGEASGKNLFATKFSEKAIFVLGNESIGISPEVREICQQFVTIPMAEKVESLNVSAAAVLVAYAVSNADFMKMQ